MKKPETAGGRIHILPPAVYRKIAAGEVIDRPAAVIRELLDNAIDSGASEISALIESGGISSIRVVDNGAGIAETDLALAACPHATSKIETEDDLLLVSTLGFRGEALASIAAVARLEIVSNPGQTAAGAHRLSASFGSDPEIEPFRGPKGTAVSVSGLFDAFPARKRFLKRAQSEGSLCRQVFVDKALAFPQTVFRFFSDGELRIFLPSQGLKERVAAAYPDAVPSPVLCEVEGAAEAFSFKIAFALPEISRHDRKYLQVFVNGRRIYEYSLVQALEYGFASYLPGGKQPIAFLFLTIDPSLVDFNIHPAKKEARIRILPDIHARVSTAIRDGLRDRMGDIPVVSAQTPPSPLSVERYAEPRLFYGMNVPATRGDPVPGGSAEAAATFAAEVARLSAFPVGVRTTGYPFRYLGQIFSLFLACEYDGALYLIDQHAAHERLIFDSLKASPPRVQELLVPVIVDAASEEEDAMMERLSVHLERAGFTAEKTGQGRWSFTAVPEGYAESVENLRRDIFDSPKDESDLATLLFARIACRSAVMDGEELTVATACAIIDGALKLENPRCPHGRPIWHRISRSDLFALVGRIV